MQRSRTERCQQKHRSLGYGISFSNMERRLRAGGRASKGDAEISSADGAHWAGPNKDCNLGTIEVFKWDG